MGYGAKPCADEQPDRKADRDAAPRPLGRPPKHEDQRRRILEAAARAIASDGYDNCSLAGIAASLGLTRPALYHYFPTKQRIYTEIALTAAAGLEASVAAAADVTRPCGEELLALMTAYAAYCDAHYWAVTATLSKGGLPHLEGSARDTFETHRRAVIRSFEDALARGMAHGELCERDVATTARFVLQLLDISHWYRPGGARRAVDFAREGCALLLDGLRDEATRSATGVAPGAAPRARSGDRSLD